LTMSGAARASSSRLPPGACRGGESGRVSGVRGVVGAGAGMTVSVVSTRFLLLGRRGVPPPPRPARGQGGSPPLAPLPAVVSVTPGAAPGAPGSRRLGGTEGFARVY